MAKGDWLVLLGSVVLVLIPAPAHSGELTNGDYAAFAIRPEGRLSIGLQAKNRWVINILLTERSKSRVGVDCGDGALGRIGFDPSTSCE